MEYKLPPLPFAVFDEFGKSCEDRVCDHFIAAIEAQGVSDGWQPIETAPKDVTLLLYGAKRLDMCVGMNHTRDGWVTDTTSEWESMYPPTHWMPLPTEPGASAPPAPQAKPQPLSDEKIVDAYCKERGMRQYVEAYVAGARFAEAAHGIQSS